jgi:hypothetical protein
LNTSGRSVSAQKLAELKGALQYKRPGVSAPGQPKRDDYRQRRISTSSSSCLRLVGPD